MGSSNANWPLKHSFTPFHVLSFLRHPTGTFTPQWPALSRDPSTKQMVHPSEDNPGRVYAQRGRLQSNKCLLSKPNRKREEVPGPWKERILHCFEDGRDFWSTEKLPQGHCRGRETLQMKYSHLSPSLRPSRLLTGFPFVRN